MDIKTYIATKKISVRDMAQRCGLSHMALYNILNGKADMRVSTMRRIIAASGGKIRPEDLL